MCNCKERRADDRNFVQNGETDRPEAAHCLDRPDHFLEQKVTHSQTEEENANAADTLLRLKGDADESHRQPHDPANNNGRQKSQPGIAICKGDIEGGKRSHQHDALDTEIENAAALAKHLADGGE